MASENWYSALMKTASQLEPFSSFTTVTERWQNDMADTTSTTHNTWLTVSRQRFSCEQHMQSYLLWNRPCHSNARRGTKDTHGYPGCSQNNLLPAHIPHIWYRISFSIPLLTVETAEPRIEDNGYMHFLAVASDYSKKPQQKFIWLWPPASDANCLQNSNMEAVCSSVMKTG